MKRIIMILTLAFSLSALSYSCREKSTGEKVEDAVESVGEEIEEGAEEIEEEVEDAVD